LTKKALIYHNKVNDAIEGERVIIEARRFSKPHPISGKTGRHGASRVKADDAEAWVEQPYVVGANLYK
jgi:hypothetical protein